MKLFVVIRPNRSSNRRRTFLFAELVAVSSAWGLPTPILSGETGIFIRPLPWKKCSAVTRRPTNTSSLKYR